MTYSSDTNHRAEAVGSLLAQLSKNRDQIFACRDPSLCQGSFEVISSLDMKKNQSNKDGQTESMLKMRAALNLRIKIAERMKQRLESVLNSYGHGM